MVKKKTVKKREDTCKDCVNSYEHHNKGAKGFIFGKCRISTGEKLLSWDWCERYEKQ